MRVPDLRRLDDRLVPEAARRLRAFVDASSAGRRRAATAAGAWWRTAAGVTGTALQRVDDRYATGPLARLRDVPQLALALVAVVFVSGAFAAVWLAEPPTAPAGPDSVLQAAPLGVPPGQDVDEHLAATRVVVEELAEKRPDARYFALVHLQRYLPVGELARIGDGLDAVRVYLQAPAVEQAEVLEVPLTGISASTVLPPLCTATAARKRTEADALRTLAASLEQTPDAPAQRQEFIARATRAATEAAAYDGQCRTLFALVVEGPSYALAALLEREGVRGVEVAPAGATVLDLQVTPSTPGSTGTAGGGAGADPAGSAGPTGNER